MDHNRHRGLCLRKIVNAPIVKAANLQPAQTMISPAMHRTVFFLTALLLLAPDRTAAAADPKPAAAATSADVFQRYIAAQKILLAEDPSVKQAAEIARQKRGVHEAKMKIRESAGRTQTAPVPGPRPAQRRLILEAQREVDLAFIDSERAQINVEEAMLVRITDPLLATTVAGQRKEIEIRQRMLTHLEQQTATPAPAKAP